MWIPVFLGGAFAKIAKKRLLASSRLICPAVCLSACLPARPHGMTWLPLEEFSLNPIFEYFFQNLSKKNQVLLNSCKNNGYFT